MPYSEAQKNAILRYQARQIKQIPLRLNLTTEADIIEWLEGQGPVNSYIKQLIRDDMKRKCYTDVTREPGKA